MTRTSTCVAGLLAALVLALAPAAWGRYARFEITVTGSQATTWREVTPANQTDPCSIGTHGDGSQMIRFKTPEPVGVMVLQTPTASGDYPVFEPTTPGTDPGITLQATVDREGTITTDTPPADPTQCGIGTGIGSKPQASNCGQVSGTVRFLFAYDTALLDLGVPGSRTHSRPNVVTMEGDQPNFGGPLALRYNNCPFPTGVWPAADPEGNLLPLAAYLPERWLFNTRRRWISLHRNAESTVTNGGTSADTIVTYNVRLRRMA